MKKSKRIFAIIVIVLLVGLYGSTLVFALIGSELSRDLLMVSVVATIVLPVLLYAFTMLYRLSNKEEDSQDK